MTDHSFTDEEQLYYQTKLAMAKRVCASLNITDPVIIAAVFGKIASDIYYLRQAQPQPIHSDGRETMDPPKPSKIFGEGTQWKQKTSPWGQAQEWSREDYLVDECHKDILQDLIRQLEGQPDAKVEEIYNGYVYWANSSSKGWYLNRRRLP